MGRLVLCLPPNASNSVLYNIYKYKKVYRNNNCTDQKLTFTLNLSAFILFYHCVDVEKHKKHAFTTSPTVVIENVSVVTETAVRTITVCTSLFTIGSSKFALVNI